MMFPPPGATITEAPLVFPCGGRNTVRNGASSGPLPVATGTFPSSHKGMLKEGSAFEAFGSAAIRDPAMATAASIRKGDSIHRSSTPYELPSSVHMAELVHLSDLD